MRRTAIVVAILFCGCRHEGYQREHTIRVVHIFGIGWIHEKTTTNDIRAFAIGSLDSGFYQVTTNTNAPMTTTMRSRKAVLRTNDTNPLGIQPRVP